MQKNQKINSVNERLVRRKTKEFSNGANCQTGRKEMRPACRAIYRAPIYNAMNYIKNVYAS